MPRPVRWKIADPRPPARDSLAAGLGVDPLVAQVLVSRGYATLESARRFLDAPLDLLTNPEAIVDLSRAADRIAQAVATREPITVYGDYDADGITATSLLLRGLTALGARPGFYLPTRAREGYGLNHAALEAIHRRGGGLVVTVDCGVTAIEEVARASQRRQELIIVDHHEPPATLPPAFAVVDPKRVDIVSPFREYSAAGLAFQLLRAVCDRLGVPTVPDPLVELAALGTIADVVPLIGDNRILARAGLAQMATPTTVGVTAMKNVIGLEGVVSVRHVGFSLAPRLNAAGRLGDAAVAVRLLTTPDPEEAMAIARQLDEENMRRQALCDQVEAEAVERVETERLSDAPAIVLADARWHPGVIGIVASRLVERYYRPTVLIAIEGGLGKGSARSIEAFHLVDALATCAELLVRGGGHAMAAGLTIAEVQIPAFTRRFVEVAGARLSPEQLVPTLEIDAEVSLDACTETLARQLAQLAPFGAGNREPVFAARGLRAVSTRLLGDGAHLRLGLTDGQGYAEAIGFRLGDASDLLAFTQARLDLAFSVALDRWEDRERVQLVLRDLQTPGVDLESVLADSRLLVDRLFARAEDYLHNGALGIEEAGAFHTKVVGVSFEGRQTLVQTLVPGDSLVLKREPNNPHDPHAIRVLTQRGDQIGYLSAKLAARLAPSVDAGTRYAATISQITGGGDRHYGVNVFVQRQEHLDEPEPGQLLRRAWYGLAPDALVDRLRMHLHRGRAFRIPQAQVVEAILSGRSIEGIFGPGRGRRTVIEAAAAAGAIARRKPVVIAVPLRSQVDRWQQRLIPRLQQLGIRCLYAHGALLFRQRQRLNEALRGENVDVLLASVEYLTHQRAGLRPALLLVDAEPTIDGNTLRLLGESLGYPQLGLFAAGIDRDGHGPVSEWGGTLERIVDPQLRLNLRLADRRDADREQTLRSLAEGEERLLVQVASAQGAAQLAATFRAHTERAVAYYHDGLPLRVREVLEQMFADGKITILVAAGLAEDVAPADLRQVVVAGLPASRSELIEHIAVAGLDGRQALATLLYQRGDLDEVRAAQAERNPTREMLAAIFRTVRTALERGEKVLWPDEQLLAGLAQTVPSRRTVGVALDILAEAGVIQREYDGEHWRITLPIGTSKRELATSLRFAEGQREAEAVGVLSTWAFGPLAEILRAVVGPSADAPNAPRAGP